MALACTTGLCACLTVVAVTAAGAASDPPSPPDLEVFASQSCPHCHAAIRFLRQLQQERPGLTVLVHDVDEDPGALERLRKLATRFGYRTVGVPAFYLSGELILGFGGPDTTGQRIRTLLEPRGPPADACLPGRVDPCIQDPATTRVPGEQVETPLFGPLDARELGLPLFTVVLGLVDGFNPCAMWVLLFLLSILVNLRDRARMAIIAGTFVLVSGLVYFSFMVAWLNVFFLMGVSRSIQLVLAGAAVLIGLFNVHDALAPHAAPLLGIPESAKPGLYARVRRIMQAENMAGALAGVVLLAVLVNAIEALCTAGFPAVYTHILAGQALPWWSYYGYLGLYNLAYMLDDALMVTLAVVTLGRRKLQVGQGRILKLVSGLVMLALGAMLLARPEWMAWAA